MADQVAMAISNARLFQQVQVSLEAERRAYGEITRRAWEQMVRSRSDLGYLCDSEGVHRAKGAWQPAMAKASRSGQTTRSGDTEIAVPLSIRGYTLGVLRLRKPVGMWSDGEIALVEAVAEQLGVALENARLYQDTQRRAARDRIVGEITDRLRSSLDPDTILKTTVEELGGLLGAEMATIEITGVEAGLQTSPFQEPAGGNEVGDDGL
jgi:GAF domain-containing protein